MFPRILLKKLRKLRKKSKGFTLVEFSLAVTVVSVSAGVVIAALNPQEQLGKVQDVERRVTEQSIKKALYQYLIEKSEFPGNLPEGEGNAKEICRKEKTDVSCINLDALVPNYLPEIPVDPAEPKNAVTTGFLVYQHSGSPRSVAKHAGSVGGKITPPPGPVCGDGVQNIGEECDDGGVIANDGCDSVCAVEPGWTCDGASPTSCTGPAGYVAYWPLDEGLNATSFGDASGNNLGGSCTTNCPIAGAASPKGASAKFNGTDKSIVVSDNSILNFGTGDFSLSAWFLLDALPGKNQYAEIISKGGDNKVGYGMEINDQGKLSATIKEDKGEKQHAAGPAVTKDTWQLGVVVFDRDDKIHLYVGTTNGTTEKSVAAYENKNNGESVNSAFDLRIGSFYEGNKWFFSGNIDDVKIYDRALSDAEVAALANGG